MRVSLALLFALAEAANGGKTTIAIHFDNACVITGDHKVKCWGRECQWDACDAPDGEYKAVTVGGQRRRYSATHGCALTLATGEVDCWGRMWAPNTEGGHTMANVAGGTPAGEFTHITAGGGHTCGIRPSGAVECWGPWADKLGVFHDDVWTTEYGKDCSSCPGPDAWCRQCQHKIPEGQYIDITAGYEFTCGVRTDKTLVCWGRVGNQWDGGAPRCLNQAQKPEARTDWNQFDGISPGLDPNDMCDRYGGRMVLNAPGTYDSVSAGNHHVCAEKDGDYTCWGSFQIWGPMQGEASLQHLCDYDEFVANKFRSGSLAAFSLTQCGITVDGELKCSGQPNPWYMDPETTHFATNPEVMAAAVAAGKSDWDVRSRYGLAGSSNPRFAGKKFASVGVGQYMGCAITDDGELMCFGNANWIHCTGRNCGPAPWMGADGSTVYQDASGTVYQGNGPTPAPTPAGTCVPSAHVDLGDCLPDDAGWATVNMDAAGRGAGDMHLTYATKELTTDSDREAHGATVGNFKYEEANGRYFLPCKQTTGQKTIKVTVTRPEAMTAFGGEWVQAFPKDSWKNVTNEYEPYTFNDFGTKIPLPEFRPTTVDENNRTIQDDAQNTTELNVFMEMSVDGDYEMRYGNPQLVTTNGKWIAVEFKKSQLRVGSPWSDCAAGGDAITTAAYGTVGTIVPAYLGNPLLLFPDFMDFAKTLQEAFTGAAASLPVKVILSIHTLSSDDWTEGDKGHTAMHCNRAWLCPDPSATSWDPVTKTGCMPKTEAYGCTDEPYNMCYKAGETCPMDHAVCKAEYCEINRWNEIIAELKKTPNVKVLGLVETKVDGEAGKRVARDPSEISADIDKYEKKTPVDGYYFNEAHGEKSVVADLMTVVADLSGSPKPFTVFGHGQPLFEPPDTAISAAGSPDVWITLHDTVTNLGVWTPFSWFSGVASSRWGAIVYGVNTAAALDDTLETILDRGYGYVYLHDSDLFNTTSGDLDTLISKIGAISAGSGVSPDRRLQALDTGVATTDWGCDDTLFACKPVCIEAMGVTRTKVADRQCSAPAPETCCRCYYDAEWHCEGDAVVCRAKLPGGEEQTVGDLVCESRGTPKPGWNPVDRKANACVPLPTARGWRPSPQCMREALGTQAAVAGSEVGDVFASSTLDLDMGDLLAGSVPTALALAVAAIAA